MPLAKLFLLTAFLGGAGGALGSMVGNSMGRGGTFAGGFLGGAALIVAAVLSSVRWGWIKPPQRLWVGLGGVCGLGLASLVTLATLSSPVGPILSTLLIGSGAILGAIVGNSPHANS